MALILINVPSSRAALLVQYVVAVAPTTLILATRSIQQGNDTIVYLQIFGCPQCFANDVEFGYIYFLDFLLFFGNSPIFFLGVHALLINTLLFVFYITVSPRYGVLAFAVFACTHTFWLINIQIMRNGISAILVALSIALLIRAWRYLSFGTGTVAISIHFSSLVTFTAIQITQFLIRRSYPLRLTITIIVFVLPGLYAFWLSNQEIVERWGRKYDDYVFYQLNHFSNSTLDFRYMPAALLLLTFMLSFRRLTHYAFNFFVSYFALLIVSSVFWSNILFRDRILLPAQVLEPALGVLCIAQLKEAKVWILAVFAVASLIWAAAIVFYWGPRNIL